MDYKKAKDLRGKKFSELMTDKLLEDQGVSEAFRKTLSEKSKARTTGIKEKFDPMNIAKVLTGGSKFGPALIGKMMGRSQEDIEYFAGKPKQKRNRKLDAGELNIHKKFELSKNDSSIQVLGLIYREMLRAQEAEKDYQLDEQKKQKDEATWEDKRNKELIDALRGRGKELTRKQKKAERRKERKEEKQTEQKKTEETKTQQKKTQEKKTEEKKVTEKTKETKKEAPPTKEAPKVEKAPPKEAPKQPEKVPAKEAPKETPKVEKAPPKEAPKEVAPSAQKAPSVGGKIATAATGLAVAGAGAVVAALVEAGLSQKAQANVLAQVEAESNFKPKSEDLYYTSAEGIQNTFGKGRIPTLEFAQTLVKNPEALANHVYAKTDGNSEVGDGYKYRGRGFLQITGKNAYKGLSDYLKMDLISNPDLLNSPEVAAKSIPWFFLNYKKYLTKGDPKQLENISTVNKAVGFANKKLKTGEMESEHREKLAEKYANGVPGVPSNQSLPASLTPATGDKIDKSSKENKELKNKSKDSSTMTQNNTTNITNKSSESPKPSKPQGDDTNAYQQKAQR